MAVSQSKRQLTLEYTGNLIKHLGLSMYSGAVPALAELISNAWDADASNVWVDIPFGHALTPTNFIVVRDDGVGMSWEDIRDHYLIIGRDRRTTRGETTAGGRTVLGRKGIGKLAGFGIAREVSVKTIRHNWLVHFLMDYDAMTRVGASRFTERYHPLVHADKRVREPNGTTVTLRQLIISRSISEDAFRDSMSRRFSLFSSQFNVHINGRQLNHSTEHLDVRYPPSGFNTTMIPGFGNVQWWIGFTREPIKRQDGRGIAVLARGKMAQAPFFFGVTTATAQFALEYMTGEVHADNLDGTGDFIGTSRQDVNWDEPVPEKLFDWGAMLIREHASKWLAHRSLIRVNHAIESYDQSASETYNERVARMPISQQRDAMRLIKRIGTLNRDDSRQNIAELVAHILDAFEGVASTPAAMDFSSATDLEQTVRLLQELAELDVRRLRQLIEPRQHALLSLTRRQDLVNLPWTRILSANPWMVSGAWRNVLVDEALSNSIAVHLMPDLEGFITRERTRFEIIAIDKQPHLFTQLSRLTDIAESFRAENRLTNTPTVRYVNTTDVTLNNRNSTIHVIDVRSLLKRSLFTYDSILQLLLA